MENTARKRDCVMRPPTPFAMQRAQENNEKDPDEVAGFDRLTIEDVVNGVLKVSDAVRGRFESGIVRHHQTQTHTQNTTPLIAPTPSRAPTSQTSFLNQEYLLHTEPSTPPSTPPESTDLTILKDALSIIRNQLNSMELSILTNISSQTQALDLLPIASPQVVYQTPNPSASGAVFGTVQVVCAVERGLEAIVAVLESGEKGEGLIGKCEREGKWVKEEMGQAVKGMIGVLKAGGREKIEEESEKEPRK